MCIRDRIRSVNGSAIHTATQLFTQVQTTRIGEVLMLEVWRKGQILQLKVTIAESETNRPATPRAASAAGPNSPRNPEEVLQALGIEVRDLAVPERLRGFRGVVVTGLTAKGHAAGLVQPGDLIMAVNSSPINSANEFFLHLAASAAAQDTLLQLIREGQSLRVTLPALPRQQ